MPYLERTPEVDLWLIALASDEFRDRQAFGSFEEKYDLHKPCYCALGLFCIANGQSPASSGQCASSGNWAYVEEKLGKEMVNVVMKWNDDARFTFPEIAHNVIECLPEGQRKGLLVDLLAGPLDLPTAMDKHVVNQLVDAVVEQSAEFKRLAGEE